MLFLKAFLLTAALAGTYFGIALLYDYARYKLLVKTERELANIHPQIVEATF